MTGALARPAPVKWKLIATEGAWRRALLIALGVLRREDNDGCRDDRTDEGELTTKPKELFAQLMGFAGVSGAPCVHGEFRDS